MRFTQIPADTAQKLAMNAGVIALDFDPDTGELESTLIIGATSGGITFTAVPTFADFAEDLDNAAKNTKEAKRITAYDVKMSGTFVTVDSAVAHQLIGAYTDTVTVGKATTDTVAVLGKSYYSRSGTSPNYTYTYVAKQPGDSVSGLYEAVEHEIVPTQDIIVTGNGRAFHDYWLIGDYSDVNTGDDAGFIAIKMKNAMTDGGLSMVTTDGEKAKFAFDFAAHYSISTPEAVPFEVYVHAGEAE